MAFVVFRTVIDGIAWISTGVGLAKNWKCFGADLGLLFMLLSYAFDRL